MAGGHDIAMALRAAYLRMHRQTNAWLAPQGMTADQFVLLALLIERDGVTQRDLAHEASSDPNTVRAMLVLLERRGLVHRRRHPDDGRALRVTLTPKGRRMYERLCGQIKPLQEILASPFESDQIQTLLQYLDCISHAMLEDRRGGRPSAKHTPQRVGKGEGS